MLPLSTISLYEKKKKPHNDNKLRNKNGNCSYRELMLSECSYIKLQVHQKLVRVPSCQEPVFL